MAKAELIARIGLDPSRFNRGLYTVRQSVSEFAKKFGTLTGLAGGAVFVKMAQDALELADQLDNTSQKLGLSVELIQELGYAGKQFGVTQETTNLALQRFTRRLGEAQQGGGELLGTLEQYGIALRDSSGRARTAEEVLADYADTIQHADTQQERLRLAFKAFDSEGAALVSVLQDGRDGLKKWGEQARESGAVMERSTVEALAKASQEIEDFRDRLTVAFANIIVNFRTADGLKLIGLELLKIAASFGGGVLDAVVQAFDLGRAVMTGTFKGVTGIFRNALVDAFAFVAEKVNDLIPDFLKNRGFAINVQGIEALRETGLTVANEINKAIAATSPTTFKHDFTSFWDDAIEKQKSVIAEQEQSQATAATTLTTAGTVAAGAIEAGAEKLKEAGDHVGETIETAAGTIEEKAQKAAESLAGAFASFAQTTRVLLTQIGDGAGRKFFLGGTSAEELNNASDAALEEIVRRARRERADYLRTSKSFGPGSDLGVGLTLANFDRTISNARSEIDFRNRFRRTVELGGEAAAYRTFTDVDPLKIERLLDQFTRNLTESERTANNVENINDRLRRLLGD